METRSDGTDYSKHMYFQWKVKWRLEHLGALGTVVETAPLILWVDVFNLLEVFCCFTGRCDDSEWNSSLQGEVCDNFTL